MKFIEIVKKPSGLRFLRVGRTLYSVQAVRGSRSAPLHGELYRSEAGSFINAGIASRNHHRWWAVTVWLYWRPAA